jgi:hypothetical protein
MTKIEAAVLIVVAVALFIGAAAWRFGSERGDQRHCNEVLGGIAVKEGFSGRTVCIKRDSVLKIYGGT